MGKIGATLPSFCLNRIRPLVRVRPPSIIQSKNHTTNCDKIDQEKGSIINGGIELVEKEEKKKSLVINGRKIMIVIDSSDESKNALQWALTHTIQSQDMLILLYVSTKSSNPAAGDNEPIKEINSRVSHFLSCMKSMCQQKRPEVQIEVAVAEGKEKGPTIVEEAKKKGVALLIIGQKKRSTTWRLLMMWAGHKVTYGVVEYCIQNASCMAIAVRKKSKKVGGYLITTKRHKDFWLLA